MNFLRKRQKNYCFPKNYEPGIFLKPFKWEITYILVTFTHLNFRGHFWGLGWGGGEVEVRGFKTCVPQIKN